MGRAGALGVRMGSPDKCESSVHSEFIAHVAAAKKTGAPNRLLGTGFTKNRIVLAPLPVNDTQNGLAHIILN